MTQLALLRECLGAFSGNEMVLGLIIGLWLLLMGIGTLLGRVADRLRDQLSLLALLLVILAVLPLLQVFGLRALRDVFFMRGAAVGLTETSVAALVLLLPYCLGAGLALTLACSILARLDGPAGIGRVYVADSLGGIVGGVLFSFVLVRSFDHLAILVWPAVLNFGAAFWLGLACHRRTLAFLAVGLALALLAITLVFDLDGVSSRLRYRHERVVARGNSPYGKLVVTESAGQFDFRENGVPINSTHDDQRVEETVHYAMAQRPKGRQVLLLSGGISGTAKEILKYPVSQVDYLELDPLILEFGRKYLPESLTDQRIRPLTTDGRLFVRQRASEPDEVSATAKGQAASRLGSGPYDVVIIDMPPPSTAQLNRFYTAEFMEEVKRVLASDGVVSFSLGQYENYVSRDLARMLASAHATLTRQFRNVLVIPGSRVFFLGSDGPLFGDIARRLEDCQLPTRLVNHHYLDAMLTPDRLEDMARATTQPSAPNRDFSPVLYYYHLRHWMSQFESGLGPVQIILLLLLGFYLFRVRGSAFVLFASGFAASALELVLLLAFQVLCGSVYHQVGIMVTVFMLGLALGAFLVNRDVALGSGFKLSPALSLSVLAFLIAAYAVLLPVALPLLSRLGGSAASLFLVKVLIGVLTLILAVLVGLQFPLANRIEFDGTTSGASRLYAADFIGACLGALLASTLLIPLVGVRGVCLLAAVLNLAGGVTARFRKAIA